MQPETGQDTYTHLNQGNLIQTVSQHVAPPVADTSQPQPQVIFVMQGKAAKTNPYPHYNRKLSYALGGMQITLGILLFGQNFGYISVIPRSALFIAAGWWSAPFIIIAGSFGIAAGARPTTCKLTTTMVMSLLSCCAAVVIIIPGSLELQRINDPESKALHGLFATLGIIEFACALAQTAIAAQSCCKPSSQGNEAGPVNFAFANQGGPLQNAFPQLLQQVISPGSNIALGNRQREGSIHQYEPLEADHTYQYIEI